MVWEVYETERATKNRPGTQTTVATFPSREEAESFKRTESGNRNFDVREIPVDRGAGTEIITREAYGYDPDRENRIKEQQRLANQAKSKIDQGQQISTAEAEAAGIKREDLVNYNVQTKLQIQRDIRSKQEQLSLYQKQAALMSQQGTVSGLIPEGSTPLKEGMAIRESYLKPKVVNTIPTLAPGSFTTFPSFTDEKLKNLELKETFTPSPSTISSAATRGYGFIEGDSFKEKSFRFQSEATIKQRDRKSVV